jgi:two-component system nitrate/nitrite response regulator NarL
MTTAATESGAPREARDSGVPPIRVFLVTDVRLYRELLAAALENEDRIELAGNTPGDVASLAIAMSEPSVVLVDASSALGPARVRALSAAAPAAKIVAVGIPDDEAVQLEFVEAGVAGYVTAEQPLAELVEAVEAAANGELKCSPRLAAALAGRVALMAGTPSTHGHGNDRLTRREHEIAGLISEGLSNKQIARRLSIQQATVKNHVQNILAKLGLSHRDQVATLVRTSLLG